MGFRAQRIDHVEVRVRDLESAVAWYSRVFGLEEVHRWQPHPVMIGVGGTMIAVFRVPDGEPEGPGPRRGWDVVAFRTDETGFAAAQEHLRRLEIEFQGPIDHDVAKSIYFSDPDENRLEITYYYG